MRREDVFWNMDFFTKTNFFDRVINKRVETMKKEQVLKSMKVEDEIYKQARRNDDLLNEVENNCKGKLPVIDKLTRDVFQSFYSLNPRHNNDAELSAPVRKFNRHIVDEVMKSSEYPAIKAVCEGRQQLSIQATEQFMEKVAENLDTLMSAANGNKNLMDTLSKLENKRDELTKELKQLLSSSVVNNQLEKHKLRLANKLSSVENQVNAIDKMVDDNLIRNDAVSAIIQKAIETAKNHVEETQAILRSWSDEQGDMSESPLDTELLDKVRSNKALLDISKYLGRFKEMLKQKRMNGFAFGRGEKYSIEQGNNISQMLSSEFSMLACDETIPLFLKKYQKKSLKQYKRRDRICKGQGDIIVCLDESSSTIGDNAAWGKAVAFAMLEIAKLNSRNFALIHFSGKSSFKTDVFIPQEYTKEDVFNSALHFFNGGTNYETPINEAVRMIENEDFSNADVIFITDGVCSISEDFVTKLKEKQAQYGFTITGVLMDQGDVGMIFSLKPFCNEVYRISEIGGDRIIDGLLSERAV